MDEIKKITEEIKERVDKIQKSLEKYQADNTQKAKYYNIFSGILISVILVLAIMLAIWTFCIFWLWGVSDVTRICMTVIVVALIIALCVIGCVFIVYRHRYIMSQNNRQTPAPVSPLTIIKDVKGKKTTLEIKNE